MYKKTNTILDRICENKVREIKEMESKQSIDDLKRIIKSNNFKKRSFAGALKKDGEISLITEIKRSSPTNNGVPFRKDFNVAKIVKIYEKNGASAISVITDKKFFMGKPDYLLTARNNSSLPILKKDFIILPFQIYEAKASGADATLLIAAILKKEQLKSLYGLTQKLGLDCLIEVHNKNELKQVLEIKPEIIGINNRDLKTMKCNINNFSKLAKLIPNNIIKVAESGIHDHNDILKMKKENADAVLVGTSLIKAGNIGKAVGKLLNGKDGKTKIKFCGITSMEDAENAIKLNVDYLGFVVDFPKSPRNIPIKDFLYIAAQIKKNTPGHAPKIVAVTVDMSEKKLNRLLKSNLTDIFQFHGNESVEVCEKYKEKIEVWKAFKPCSSGKDTCNQIKKFKGKVDKYLIDASSAKDKERNRNKRFRHLDLFELLQSRGYLLILAGGLNLKNIKNYVQKLKPAIIDVSGGIEKYPGKKDKEKMEKFIKIINLI